MTGRPACQLYLVAEAALDAGALEAALAAAPVACLLLPAETAGLQALCRQAQARDVAVLIADDTGQAMAAEADGVHLTAAGPAVKAVRQALGADAILGVACGQSRHDALLAAEAGADYVAFGTAEAAADPELLAWWQETITLPCVALGGVSLENAAELARAGADFVALGQALWQDVGALAALAPRLAGER